MYPDLLLLLFTPNLISISLWSAVTIFLVPHRPLFGLYLGLVFALFAIFYFPTNKSYLNRSVADDFGEAIFYLITIPLLISILVWIIFIIANILKSNHRLQKQEKLPELILLNKIVLFSYGAFFGVWTFLCFTNLLERYHPAWEAYAIVAIFVLFYLLIFDFFKRPIKVKRYIHKQLIFWFIYSYCIAILFLLLISFSFASIAAFETRKIIKRYTGLNAEYCIQYMKIDTWLDLTPLTTWNKPSRTWGATTNHAILVVKTPNNAAHLYN